MPQPRTHLYSSTTWSILRPKFALTAGHFALRLNDPAIAFDAGSAADLLHCYGQLRRALTELAGATAASVYLSLNWQPVGNAIGEPLAETSTPTVHAFFSWPGSTTAALPLRLPAHERVAAVGTEALDEALRNWQGEKAPGTPGGDQLAAAARQGSTVEAAETARAARAAAASAAGQPGGGPWDSGAFHVEPARPTPGEPFRGGHWTAVPLAPLAALDKLDPAAALELASGMAVLASHSRPPFSGVTVWATDVWDSQLAPTINIFGRQHGDPSALLAEFVTRGGLDLPG